MHRMPIAGPAAALLIGSLLLASASVRAHPTDSPAQGVGTLQLGGRASSVLGSPGRAVSPDAPASRERGVQPRPEDPPTEAEIWRAVTRFDGGLHSGKV